MKFGEFFRDEQGNYSSGRLIMALFSVFGVAWVSYIVYLTKALPDFGGLAFFIGFPYIISKGSDKATDLVGNVANLWIKKTN